MRTLIHIAIFAAALGCKGRHETVVTPVTDDPQRPAWVSSRPVSSAYYVGVGMAPRSRPDHQETAKMNALNDLASEISVNVEGNSLLYTLDRRTQFDETFTNTVRTTTSEQIEGFELVDSWENANETWTYYRLSKAEHARIKAERKAQAIGTATDLYARSRTSLSSGDLRGAVDQDLRALIAMKAYWGENDLVDIDGKQVPLVNELYADLQRHTSSVHFSILPERCVLDHGNRFKRELMVSATYGNGGTSQDLIQLPVSISYSGISGPVVELKSTDAEGRLRTTIQRVDVSASVKEVLVKLDIDRLVSPELEPPLVKALLASLTVPEKRAIIELAMPKVFMRASETNLGVPVGDAGVAMPVREEMTKRGFRFVDREADADLLMNLNATTRQGGESSGFFTTFLDVTYTVRDRRSQDVVHEGGKQAVKGVQLAYDKAGLDAYKKAAADVRKELIPAMMSALF